MKNLSYFMHSAVLVLFIAITLPCSAVTNYYSNATGNLNLTSSWGTGTNGTGTVPANFTANNQVFNICNNATPTISANWTVSGTGSNIVVGDGTNPCNFQIPSGFTCQGTINVSAKGTLTIANTTIPNLSTLNATSTVVFDGTSSQTIPAVTYGNLTYSGSATGVMAGGCTIGGKLSVSSGILELDNTNNNYTFSIDTMNVTTPNDVDFGASGTGSATVNLTGPLTQTGSGQLCSCGANSASGYINFSGTSETLQEVNDSYINYTVENGSTVTLASDVELAGQSGGWTATFTINSGATLDCGTHIINSNGSSDEFTLSSGGTLITANTAGINSSTSTGSVQAMARTFSNGANYTYDGSAAQVTGIFTTTGSTVNNLTIDNSSTEGVTLSQPENVAGVLTLTDGLLTTSLINLITVNNSGSTTGASNNSFVNGPITKVGKQAFVFPVGAAGTGYIPIGISAPSSTSDAFLAQYNRASALLLGIITAVGLNHVSNCDYWTLNHTAGSSTVNVTGYWNANSPCGSTYINNTAAVALAHFSLTSLAWNAFGNNVISGTNASGSVTWNNVSNFSPFALGSTTAANPLPLTLVDFNAAWQAGGTVGLTWEVEDGLNTNHFDIQRSAEGVDWQTIGTLDANGSSALATDYSYTDASPLPTQDYYRLQLVDDAGNDTYSAIKVVSQSADNGIKIFPNPASDHINVSFGTTGVSGPVSIRLMNTTGQVLLQESVSQPAGETITLPVTGYPAGSYLVQVIGEGEIKQSSIVLIVK
jgi:hypothetical protein